MSLVSIVVPVYNNAASLPRLVRRLNALATTNDHHQFDLIFVDDGSVDNSFAVLKEILEQGNQFRIVKLARNFGSNIAILAGMTYARGDCVGFVAADLQDPPEALSPMLHLWEAGAPGVLAVRKDRDADPWSTRIFANAFNWLFKKLVFSDFEVQGVGFFLVDRNVAINLLQCKEKNPHVIGLLLWLGYDYQIIDYERADREHGKSQWTFSKKLKYSIDAFVSFSYLPLRLVSAMGLITAGLGAVYALIIIWLRLINQIPLAGWTTLMVVLLLTAGTQMLMLGIIGEYLWRNFDATRQRPLFVAESVIEMNEQSMDEPAMTNAQTSQSAGEKK